jgi:hypothetical protein
VHLADAVTIEPPVAIATAARPIAIFRILMLAPHSCWTPQPFQIKLNYSR